MLEGNPYGTEAGWACFSDWGKSRNLWLFLATNCTYRFLLPYKDIANSIGFGMVYGAEAGWACFLFRSRKAPFSDVANRVQTPMTAKSSHNRNPVPASE
jgi:hypothetical protein